MVAPHKDQPAMAPGRAPLGRVHAKPGTQGVYMGSGHWGINGQGRGAMGTLPVATEDDRKCPSSVASFVLQVARGVTGAEVQWVRSNRERVEGLWAEAA